MDAVGMQQWHKGPRPETAATTGKQGKFLDLQADPSVGDHEMNSWAFVSGFEK
jgi:hypothetical protein